MPKISYVSKKFSASTMDIIEKANSIIEEYQELGYDLTLRQLFYQFVARGYIKNKDSEYKRLGSIVGDARLAGLIDWESITDRTRNLRSNSHWGDAGSIIESAARSFALDKWFGQEYRPEVWVEKEALAGIVETACEPLDVPFFSCRGYTSLSEIWAAARRLSAYSKMGQQPIVFHLGDHDPSGIDMSRDIKDRLKTFGAHVEFRRLALNIDQVREYDPPPNPAKTTDSRFTLYQEIYGEESWELDALDPAMLAGLIRENVASIRDDRRWNRKVEKEALIKEQLDTVSNRWDEIVEYINEN